MLYILLTVVIALFTCPHRSPEAPFPIHFKLLFKQGPLTKIQSLPSSHHLARTSEGAGFWS